MYIPITLKNARFIPFSRCAGEGGRRTYGGKKLLKTLTRSFAPPSPIFGRGDYELSTAKCNGYIQTKKHNRTKVSGFSLIELMVAVAIIGILAAIAIPSYVNYINKAHLAEIFSSIKQDEANIMSYTTTAKMPGSAGEAAAMLATIGGMAVCNSTYVSKREGECTFGQYGIRIVTDNTKLPDIRVNFTPKEVGKMIEWGCTYETETASAGIEILPLNCRLVTNPTNATALW